MCVSFLKDQMLENKITILQLSCNTKTHTKKVPSAHWTKNINWTSFQNHIKTYTFKGHYQESWKNNPHNGRKYL